MSIKLDYDKPIWREDDGLYRVHYSGDCSGVLRCSMDDPLYPELIAYISAHPEVVTEKLGPTKAERARAITAELSDIDAKSTRPLRSIAFGEGTDTDKKRLAELDAQAAALRAELAKL